MEPDELKQQKELALYTAQVDAWVTTSFERDKSLLTLSAGGIGLLLTILRVFQRNKKHLEAVLAGKTESEPLK